MAMVKKGTRGPKSVVINASSLRVIRKMRGLGVQEFADAMGVKRALIYRWEWGEVSPTVAHFQKLCEVLDVPPVQLEASSLELEDLARHERVIKYYQLEIMGENDVADYREVQLIRADIQAVAERESQEEGVRTGEVTVPSSGKPPEDREPDIEGGDGDGC